MSAKRTGALEIDTLAWVVVGVLLVMTIMLMGLADFEWRRSRVTIAKTDQQTSE